MSQQQFPWTMGLMTPPQDAVPCGTVNPADMLLRPATTTAFPVPARQDTNINWPLQPQRLSMAAPQSEMAGDAFRSGMASPSANFALFPLANPPADTPARQEATFAFAQPLLRPVPAAQQPENDGRAAIPDNDDDFFVDTLSAVAQQPGCGPQPILGHVSDEVAEEMLADGRETAKRRKLGPRRPQNAAGAAALRQQAPAGVEKSRRPGPRKAGPGQQGYAHSVRSHATHCREAEGCKSDCPLRSDWPEVYARLSEKKKKVKVDGQPTWVKRLWSHEYEDLSNREH